MIKIVQLDHTGTVEVEAWTINNPQLTNVNFGQLDYSQEGLINIDVTIAYDWATCEIEGKTLWALNKEAAGGELSRALSADGRALDT